LSVAPGDTNVGTSRQVSVLALPAHRRSLLPVVGAACLVTSVNFGAHQPAGKA
jgi:hypothetical protein